MRKPGRPPALFVVACFITIVLGSWIATSAVQKTSLVPGQGGLFGALSSHHKECSFVDRHEDQCAFVERACKGFSRFYLKFYYCSEIWKPISLAVLVSGLLMLFGAVSVVASDYFCPNLQTISTKLQLSESMAGVTVLAFGNGSPDLFSTFSAMDTGAGSLAIGELIGAAFFIVSVVSGSMGIIQPFTSKRITFMRDASFLTGAIIMLTWIVYHRRILWYHGVALIAFYLTYVFVVVFGALGSSGAETPAKIERKSVTVSVTSGVEGQLTEASRLLQNGGGRHAKPPRLTIPPQGFSSQHSLSSHESHFGHIIRPVSPNSSHRSSLQIEGMNLPRTTSTNGSISARLYRHAMSPRIGIRTSVFSAIEFQEQITALRRTGSSSHTIQPTMRRRQTSVTSSQGWNRQRSSNTSIPGLLTRGLSTSGNGRSYTRPRSSTVGDNYLMPGSYQLARSTTPESNNSSTGLAEDYFTYISANQNRSADKPCPRLQDGQDRDMTIPEIRLAPAKGTDQDQAPYSSVPGTASDGQPDSDQKSISIPVPTTIPSPLQHPPAPCTTVWIANGRIAVPVSWYLTFEDVFQTLFPTLRGWSEKTAFAKLSSLIAIPVVLIFTLTLPVAEEVKVDDIEVPLKTDGMRNDCEEDDDDDDPEDQVNATAIGSTANYLAVPAPSYGADADGSVADDELLLEQDVPTQDWCRWLLAVQAILATTFVFSIMAINEFIPPNCIFYGFLIGCFLAVVALKNTEANEPPKWYWMLSFAGFIVALNWIFLLANQMVGLLQALGTILNISDAIMGLTIFALGNSVGDLVANTAIAKMGYPTMAISACYAGPLLNMVLGIGISSVYQTFKSGHSYELDIAPSILVSCGGLITVLLSTLIAVNLNGYRIDQGLGWWMIIVYSTCCVINVLLECEVI